MELYPGFVSLAYDNAGGMKFRLSELSIGPKHVDIGRLL